MDINKATSSARGTLQHVLTIVFWKHPLLYYLQGHANHLLPASRWPSKKRALWLIILPQQEMPLAGTEFECSATATLAVVTSQKHPTAKIRQAFFLLHLSGGFPSLSNLTAMCAPTHCSCVRRAFHVVRR